MKLITEIKYRLHEKKKKDVDNIKKKCEGKKKKKKKRSVKNSCNEKIEESQVVVVWFTINSR